MLITGAILTLSTLQVPAGEPAPVPPPAPPAASLDGSPFAPGGGPPLIGVVERIEGDKIVFRFMRSVTVAETQVVPEAVAVEENGVTVTKTITKQVMVTKEVQQVVEDAHPLREVRVFDLDAKPVATSRFSTIFAKPCIVLYQHAHGGKVDAAYLKVARPGVVFVSLPAPVPAPAVPGVPVLPPPTAVPAPAPPPAAVLPAPPAVTAPAPPALP